ECHKTLGHTQDLALTITPHKIEDMASLMGTWHVAVTHRACRKESVRDVAKQLPQHTYTTTLLALPVINTDGLPSQVPTLLVNPSVDHFMLYRDSDGVFHDALLRQLEDEGGFTRMGHSDDRTPEAVGLQAYITGA